MKRENLPAAAVHESLLQFLYCVPIGLVHARVDGAIVMMNPAALRLLLPLSCDASMENLYDMLALPAPQLRSQVAASGPGDVVFDDLRLVVPEEEPGGGPRVLSLQVLRLDDATLMASLSDVTLQAQQEQQRIASQLRDAQRTDLLTRLPTRSVVRERIERALLAGGDPRWLAVLHINVDRFSRFNVTLGQHGGDELLRGIAERLVGAVRARDSIAMAGGGSTAARIGGDEFVVLMEGLASSADATRAAGRLLETLCRPYAVGDRPLHATVSIGLSVAGVDDGPRPDADTLLQNANLGMREAKREGGGRWRLFEPTMKLRAQRRGDLEADLRSALDRGELRVAYQPIVDLRDGEGFAAGRPRVLGVEALVRWNHPARGPIPPPEFIDVAEQTGLIVPLGEFVLETACRQFADWRRRLRERAPGCLSVNLSPAQVTAEAAIGQRVRDVLATSGLEAGSLQLEITESLAVQDEQARARLREIQQLGVRLALDDFGTGYSSLARLHELPVDVVKIDRSFVAHVEDNLHHRTLVQATLLVAGSLGLQTVAEGVETAGQARLLADLGCDRAQGYLFARPMSVDDATTWLATR